jgi:hypothetical protein
VALATTNIPEGTTLTVRVATDGPAITAQIQSTIDNRVGPLQLAVSRPFQVDGEPEITLGGQVFQSKLPA